MWRLQIYINGILDAETTLSAVENISNTSDLNLCSRATASQFINGTFDEIAYYVGKSLTADEALDHYNARYGLAGGFRQSGKLRFELESERDTLASYQMYNVTVERTGYGFNYGKRYGN